MATPRHTLPLTSFFDYQCRTVDPGHAGEDGEYPISVYARLASVDTFLACDLQEGWELPECSFIVPGSVLREALDDLEWTRGDVALTVRRDPRGVRLSSVQGALALEVGHRFFFVCLFVFFFFFLNE
jgi:hypothetical protein